MNGPPEGYLGTEGRVRSGPSEAMVDTGYRLETADAFFLHRPLCLADLAHLLELNETRVIPADAAAALGRELLDIVATSVDDFPYDPIYGDAYNSRERELERRLGAAAGWLPTGRTRREAGRIAFRLALRSRLLDLNDAVVGFGRALTTRAVELAPITWNDTTYLQPAQPSTFGHYLAGFAEQATRDLERIRLAHRWANRSPSGVGGVAGTSIPLDRTRLALRLGFEGPGLHTRDAMWSVDGLTDAVVAATQAVITADRLVEDLEIFASPQFGYVRLAGSSTRASVLLPQKRNPYALAVIRGGAGTLIGRTTGIMATQRTPSARTDNWLYAYGEVFGAVDLAARLMRLATEVVAGLEVDTAVLVASTGSDFSTSADLTERIVLDHHLDYRTAYRLVGRAVAEAADNGRSQLAGGDLARAATELGIAAPPGLDAVLEIDASAFATSRDVLGGSAPHRVLEHCGSVALRLAESETWSTRTRARATEAETAVIDQADSLWSS